MGRLLQHSLSLLFLILGIIIFIYPKEAQNYMDIRYHSFIDAISPLGNTTLIYDMDLHCFYAFGMLLILEAILTFFGIYPLMVIFGYALLVLSTLLHITVKDEPIRQSRKLLVSGIVYICMFLLMVNSKKSNTNKKK